MAQVLNLNLLQFKLDLSCIQSDASQVYDMGIWDTKLSSAVMVEVTLDLISGFYSLNIKKKKEKNSFLSLL